MNKGLSISFGERIQVHIYIRFKHCKASIKRIVYYIRPSDLIVVYCSSNISTTDNQVLIAIFLSQVKKGHILNFTHGWVILLWSCNVAKEGFVYKSKVTLLAWCFYDDIAYLEPQRYHWSHNSLDPTPPSSLKQQILQFMWEGCKYL